MKNKKDEVFEKIIKQLNLYPFQERMVREMWETETYLIPKRGNGLSTIETLLVLINILSKYWRM